MLWPSPRDVTALDVEGVAALSLAGSGLIDRNVERSGSHPSSQTKALLKTLHN
jgi:hypothetical protein